MVFRELPMVPLSIEEQKINRRLEEFISHKPIWLAVAETR